MGDPDHIERYRQANIKLLEPGTAEPYRKQGDVIVFAITIPKTVRHKKLAEKYVSFIIGPKGRKILEQQQMTVIDQPFTYDLASVPESLRAQVLERQQTSSR